MARGNLLHLKTQSHKSSKFRCFEKTCLPAILASTPKKQVLRDEAVGDTEAQRHRAGGWHEASLGPVCSLPWPSSFILCNEEPSSLNAPLLHGPLPRHRAFPLPEVLFLALVTLEGGVGGPTPTALKLSLSNHVSTCCDRSCGRSASPTLPPHLVLYLSTVCGSSKPPAKATASLRVDRKQD